MASLKRKSNAADLSRDKSSSKRRRNNAQSARSETSRKKSVGTPLKPDTDSSKSTRPGSLVLGQIISINRHDVAVALPNNLTGYVPLTAISSRFTTKIEDLVNDEHTSEADGNPSDEENETDPKRYFRIGQYVRAAVIS